MLSGLAVAAVVACLSLPAAVQATVGATFAARATSLAYPVADLVLLGTVVSAVGLEGWRLNRVWMTLAVATIAWVGADLIYLLDVQSLFSIADAWS